MPVALAAGADGHPDGVYTAHEWMNPAIMPVPANLQDIIDALDVQFAETFQFLNRETGTVVVITSEDFAAAENGDDLDKYPAWQHAAIELAGRIMDDRDQELFLRLPSRFEVNEYAIMEDFCDSLADPRMSSDLAAAIQGRGAFRRFKDRIHFYGIEQQWYTHRHAALTRIARAWCEQHDIPYL